MRHRGIATSYVITSLLRNHVTINKMSLSRDNAIEILITFLSHVTYGPEDASTHATRGVKLNDGSMIGTGSSVTCREQDYNSDTNSIQHLQCNVSTGQAR